MAMSRHGPSGSYNRSYWTDRCLLISAAEPPVKFNSHHSDYCLKDFEKVKRKKYTQELTVCVLTAICVLLDPRLISVWLKHVKSG